jgi:hypothetical protein
VVVWEKRKSDEREGYQECVREKKRKELSRVGRVGVVWVYMRRGV